MVIRWYHSNSHDALIMMRTNTYYNIKIRVATKRASRDSDGDRLQQKLIIDVRDDPDFEGLVKNIYIDCYAGWSKMWTLIK